MPNVPLAGRHFHKSSKMLTKGKEVLSFVVGFQIPSLQELGHKKVPVIPCMNPEKMKQVHLGVDNMLRKGTIPVSSTEKGISKQSVPSRKKE